MGSCKRRRRDPGRHTGMAETCFSSSGLVVGLEPLDKGFCSLQPLFDIRQVSGLVSASGSLPEAPKQRTFVSAGCACASRTGSPSGAECRARSQRGCGRSAPCGAGIRCSSARRWRPCLDRLLSSWCSSIRPAHGVRGPPTRTAGSDGSYSSSALGCRMAEPLRCGPSESGSQPAGRWSDVHCSGVELRWRWPLAWRRRMTDDIARGRILYLTYIAYKMLPPQWPFHRSRRDHSES